LGKCYIVTQKDRCAPGKETLGQKSYRISDIIIDSMIQLYTLNRHESVISDNNFIKS